MMKIDISYFDKTGAEVEGRVDTIEMPLQPNVHDTIEKLSFRLDQIMSTPKGWGRAVISIERIEDEG